MLICSCCGREFEVYEEMGEKSDVCEYCLMWWFYEVCDLDWR